MAETYVVVRTVEDTLANETIVATVAAGARPKWNKAKAQTRAAELANEFKMQNNYRRVDFDCKEVKDDGTSVIFHSIVLDNPLFGKIQKSDLDKLVDQINKENTGR